jgi:hypothetical protein
MAEKSRPDLDDLVYGLSKFNDLPSILTGALEDFVRRHDNVIRMETAVSLGRAPVEALSDQLIHEFGKEIAHPRIRQFIGQLVRQVMEHIGYEADRGSLRITRLNVFSSGTRYRRACQARDRSVPITSEERRAWLNDQQGDAFNRWLDAQVVKSDGTIDVERFLDLADEWGAEYPEGVILNAGTPKFPAERVRLLFGILLRGRVPPSEYEPIEESESLDKLESKPRSVVDPYANTSFEDLEAELQKMTKGHVHHSRPSK